MLVLRTLTLSIATIKTQLRQQVVEMVTMEKNRLHSCESWVRASVESVIAALESELETLEARLAELSKALAPCIKHGKIPIRVAGMMYTFVPQPKSFEGWGIFQSIDKQFATLIEPANLAEISTYLQ